MANNLSGNGAHHIRAIVKSSVLDFVVCIVCIILPIAVIVIVLPSSFNIALVRHFKFIRSHVYAHSSHTHSHRQTHASTYMHSTHTHTHTYPFTPRNRIHVYICAQHTIIGAHQSTDIEKPLERTYWHQ